MTTVLVTGANGFIGRILVNYLLKKHLIVRVLVRKAGVFPHQVEQCIGDLTETASLIAATQGVETVFHLGGYAHAWKAVRGQALLHQQVNCDGVKNILEACIKNQIKKFVFFSTVKAVADSHTEIDERFNEQPNSAYGLAKRQAEDFVLAAGKMHGLHVAVLRLALVYGPGVKGNLYRVLRAIDKGYFLPMPSVQNQRSLVNVHDVCEAAWLAAESPQANGKIYYVTDKNDYATHEIYALMYVALNRKKPKRTIPLWFFKLFAWMGDLGERWIKRRFPFNSDAFQKLFGSSQYRSILIQQELGWIPRYSLAEVLPEMIQHYKDSGKK